jgi:hypothetical protein
MGGSNGSATRLIRRSRLPFNKVPLFLITLHSARRAARFARQRTDGRAGGRRAVANPDAPGMTNGVFI